MQYDDHTAAVLKAQINARVALDALELAKRALREIPAIYNPERVPYAPAEDELNRILATANAQSREMGMGER